MFAERSFAIARHASTRAGRAFGCVMPLAMYASIVLTGNHYVLDGLAGGALVLASLWLIAVALPGAQSTSRQSGEPSNERSRHRA